MDNAGVFSIRKQENCTRLGTLQNRFSAPAMRQITGWNNERATPDEGMSGA